MNTRNERGMVWPAEDVECAAVVFSTTQDMLPALSRCKGMGIAVQAGGNCGVWPKWLADYFRTVYTFEPDPLNYYCLDANCREDNIVKRQAALGNEHGRVDLHRDPTNVGAHYIEGTGGIEVVRIDDLGLESCDYICLDVEGYELRALKGAEQTLRRFHPVIQVEDKGLSTKYGSEKGDIEKWLVQFGYEVVARPHRDVILA